MARWATVEQTAEHLATTVRALRNLCHTRQIPFHKMGRQVRFDLEEVDAWLKSAEQTPRAHPVLVHGRRAS